MQFWSKGLGKKTIQLYLSKGESIHGGDRLYLQGRMEAPVSWEYIMPMRGIDLVDFFALLKEPTVAAYVHASPRRWQLYGAMLLQGLQLAALVLVQTLRTAMGRVPAASRVVIEVPPPSVLEAKRKKKTQAKAEVPERKAYRKRLGALTTSAPSLSQGMRQQAPDEDSIEDAIREAMEAAESISS